MRDRLQAIAKAARFSEDEIQSVSTPADLWGAFQRFFPSGDGVDAVFAGIPGGDEVAARLKRCFEPCAAAHAKGEPYFVPQRGQCGEDEGLALARDHIAAMRGIAALWAEEDLIKRVDRASLEIASEADIGDPLHDRSPQTQLHDMAGDYMAELADPEHPGAVLEEAFRSVSADFLVRSYLTWPFVADASSLEDPFEAYFKLWLRGVRIHFIDDHNWLVCLE